MLILNHRPISIFLDHFLMFLFLDNSPIYFFLGHCPIVILFLDHCPMVYVISSDRSDIALWMAVGHAKRWNETCPTVLQIAISDLSGFVISVTGRSTKLDGLLICLVYLCTRTIHVGPIFRYFDLYIQSNLSCVTLQGKSEIWSHQTGGQLIQVLLI